MIIDRDQSSTWDHYENSIAFSGINGTSTNEYTFTYTPTDNGNYYSTTAAYVNWSGDTRLTDSSPWSSAPLFTVATYNAEFDIFNSQKSSED